MQPYQIILIILAVILIGAATFLGGLQYHSVKHRKSLPREIGVIIQAVPAKLPWLEQYQINVSKKGRPIPCVSALYKKGRFKVGAKVPVVLEEMTQKGQKYKIAYIMQKRKK